jgi:hypothetical protein
VLFSEFSDHAIEAKMEKLREKIGILCYPNGISYDQKQN